MPTPASVESHTGSMLERIFQTSVLWSRLSRAPANGKSDDRGKHSKTSAIDLPLRQAAVNWWRSVMFLVSRMVEPHSQLALDPISPLCNLLQVTQNIELDFVMTWETNCKCHVLPLFGFSSTFHSLSPCKTLVCPSYPKSPMCQPRQVRWSAFTSHILRLMSKRLKKP